MVKVPPLEEVSNRWVVGMLRTPPMPCWNCGRKTRAWWGSGRCQWCGAHLPYPQRAVTR